MTIENCALGGDLPKIARQFDGKFYVYANIDNSICGPSCDDEETAIRYWNAMQRGLKMEVEK